MDSAHPLASSTLLSLTGLVRSPTSSFQSRLHITQDNPQPSMDSPLPVSRSIPSGPSSQNVSYLPNTIVSIPNSESLHTLNLGTLDLWRISTQTRTVSSFRTVPSFLVEPGRVYFAAQRTWHPFTSCTHHPIVLRTYQPLAFRTTLHADRFLISRVTE